MINMMIKYTFYSISKILHYNDTDETLERTLRNAKNKIKK